MLTFEEDNHIYKLDGIVIPSVTQVLPSGSWFTEQARLRGQYVHTTIELYRANELDEDNLDPALRGYLDSFKKAGDLPYQSVIIDYKSGAPHPCTPLQLAGYAEMVQANNKEIIGHEIKMHHPIYRYAGTIDYLCYTPDAGLRVFALYLFPDGKQGKYVEHTKDLQNNINIFLSFLTTYKWKEANLREEKK